MNIKFTTKLDIITAKLSYFEVVNCAARVATVVSSQHVVEFGLSLKTEIEEHARRDLVLLALSMRRLAEICNLETILKDSKILHVRPYMKRGLLGFYPTRRKPKTCWEAIGKLIHHRNLNFYHDEITLRIMLGLISRDAYEIYTAKRSKNAFATAFMVQSDKGDPVFMLTKDIVSCSLDLIHEAEDVLADKEIYVGSWAID